MSDEAELYRRAIVIPNGGETLNDTRYAIITQMLKENPILRERIKKFLKGEVKWTKRK